MNNVTSLIDKINQVIVDPLIVLLFALAVLIFFVGILQFFFTDAPDKRAQGTRHMLWGVIGMVIMVSVFAIINVIINFITSF